MKAEERLAKHGEANSAENYWIKRAERERATTAWFRDYCLDTFYLRGHRYEPQLMGLLGEVIYSTWRDDCGRVILPHGVIRAAVGKGFGSGDASRCSADWLKMLGKHVPMTVSAYSVDEREARTVDLLTPLLF